MTHTDPLPAARADTFACEGPVELDVRLRRGRLAVRAVETSAVRVELAAEPEGADPGIVDETRVELVDGRLVVRAPRGFGRGGLCITIEAPRGSRLKAHAHHAAVDASGLLGGLVAATGNGTIAAEHVEGPTQVVTGNGSVRLGRVAGPLRARLGSGAVELDTFEGPGASIATGNGDIRLGAVTGDLKLRTGRGGITVGEAGAGTLSLASGNGDLHVGLRAGIAAQLDLKSGSGDVRSELEVSDRPPESHTPLARIRMRTGSGSALVGRASGALAGAT